MKFGLSLSNNQGIQVCILQDQDAEHKLIFLYDNHAYRPALPQLQTDTSASCRRHSVPTWAEVLDQILR